MSVDPLLQVRTLAKRFGGFTALEGIEFEVATGERVGLIGPNGSGKSTFVGCVGGSLRNDEGGVWFDGRRIDKLSPHERVRQGLVRSFQLPRPFRSLSVQENLRIPIFFAGGGRANSAARTSAIEERVAEVLNFVGLGNKAQTMPADLTQVELRKLDLARAVAAEPRLLFVDEAMAGLSHSEVDEVLALLRRLNERGIAIVMIEHIMRAVMSFSQRLVVFVAGRKIADGDPNEVMRNPDVQRAYLGE
jgi:branched-chain amino acid transport system ATP-binding protein